MNNAKESQKTTWCVRATIAAVILIAAMMAFPASVRAERIIKTKTVQAGVIIDNDIFLTGENPLVEGTVNGDVFVFGRNLVITGEVNGSVIAIADKVKLEGKINGNLYTLTAGYVQKSEAEIERSLYLLGMSLVFEKDAIIGRDLNAITLSAGLRGDIGRDSNATVGLFELLRLLRESVNRSITGIPSAGQFAQATSQRITQRLTDLPRRALLRMSSPSAPSTPSVQWLLASLTALVTFLIVGLLALWIFPKRFQTWTRQLEKRPLASAGYGAIVLVNGYLVPLLLVALLGGAVLGLLYLSLPALAWMLFWGALGLFIAVFSLFLIAVTFLSKTIVAYWVGEFILKRLAPQALDYKILPLLLGLFIYVPLASVRYVGFFVGLVVTLLGLGTLWLSRPQAQIKSDPEAELAKDTASA